MTAIIRSGAAGMLLLALALPSAAVLADSGTDAARDNLAQVFDPTLRPGATQQQSAMAQSVTAQGDTPSVAQAIFDRYWGFDQSRPQQRVSFAAFENVAQDNIDTLFKKQ